MCWPMISMSLKSLCNKEMIDFESLDKIEDINEVSKLILNHFDYTGSIKADYILDHWE